MRRLILLLFAPVLAMASPAHAEPQFPPLTGRVVDAANIIPDDVEASLTQKLAALETQSQRQLVVATIPDLQGYDIEDYGYQLGRHWAIGTKGRDDGAILIVAPNERKVRIEIGYGLEGIVTDGLSSLIIQQQIIPHFKNKDMPGGIVAGTDALIAQLQLPEDEARKVAAEAGQRQSHDGGGSIGFAIFMFIFLFFFLIPFFAAMRGRRGHRGFGSAVGNVLLWSALNAATHGSRGGGDWGGGSSGGGFGGFGGGGGFSGGGGSFGGGGASGSW
jgi:uncharacterized protein